jgi:hypothetical protein
MEAWFQEETEDIFLSPFLFPLEVRQVMLHQNTIGWRQVFNGRFATAWSTVQDDFQERQETAENIRKRQRMKGKQWQKRFIVEIWKQWTVLWKTRNEMVHGKSLITRTEANRRNTESALRLVYDSKEQLETAVQRLLFPEVHDHIQQHPTYTTRNWLQINGPVLRESLRRAKRRAVAGVRSIRSYFAPVR